MRCTRVGSRPGPLVLSMNFIDGGDGSAIRAGYASMNAPQSQPSSSSSQSVVCFLFLAVRIIFLCNTLFDDDFNIINDKNSACEITGIAVGRVRHDNQERNRRRSTSSAEERHQRRPSEARQRSEFQRARYVVLVSVHGVYYNRFNMQRGTYNTLTCTL